MIFTNVNIQRAVFLVVAGRVESGSGCVDTDPAFLVNPDQDMDPVPDPDPGF